MNSQIRLEVGHDRQLTYINNCSMNRKTPTDIFWPPFRLLSVVAIFLNSILVFLLFVFFVGFAEHIYSMKTVKLWSSTLPRGHKSINLSVLNSNKVAFVIHESQKVASNLFMIRSCFKLYSSLLKCIYYFFLTGTNQLCLRVTACISYRVMCFRFGQCSSLKRSISESHCFSNQRWTRLALIQFFRDPKQQCTCR